MWEHSARPSRGMNFSDWLEWGESDKSRLPLKSHFEQGRYLPSLAQTQVLVVGGGPAGIAAAIASARVGARTLLVEGYGCFGGNITQCGVEAVAWYRHEGTVEAGGLLKEIEETAQKMGAAFPECQSDSSALDTELFKHVADKMLLDAGVRPLLHCRAVEAIVEDGKIRGVITESKSGRQAIFAQRVVDCTGDADIAVSAGAPYEKLPKSALMAVTPVFHVSQVDTLRFRHFIETESRPTYRDWGGYWSQEGEDAFMDLFSPYLESCFLKAQESGLIPTVPNVTLGGTYSDIRTDGSVTQMNLVFLNQIDCTDVWDLTRAEIQGRQNALWALTAMRKYLPGFEKARLRNFAMKIGIRDSRRIKGMYRLTADDVMNEARFEDSVGIFPEFVDGRGVLLIPTTGRYYQVPYRALVPQKVDNLLAAGRCISGDELAFCSFRSISCCVLTGQAAGAAAAVSLQEGRTTQNVTVELLQEALRRQNVRLT